VNLRKYKCQGFGLLYGIPGYAKFEKILGRGLTQKLGWANNYSFINNVVKKGGTIYNLGGSLTGSYGREMLMLRGYWNLRNMPKLFIR
jgi:hypothetical protein